MVQEDALNDRETRQAIVDAVRFLEDKGLNHGSTGNVSVRHGERALITPTGGRSSWLTPEGVIDIGLDGDVRGDGKPSSEWRFHTQILKARPEANAVVHTHADSCVALSCLRKPIPAFHYMIASFGGSKIPCSRYEPFGSGRLAEAALEALDGHFACLLANHGMIVIGKTLQHALDLAVKLEMLARQYILALQAGGPVLLDPAEMAEVSQRYRSYGIIPLPA